MNSISSIDDVGAVRATILDREVLYITADGDFIWSDDCDDIMAAPEFLSHQALGHLLIELRRLQLLELTLLATTHDHLPNKSALTLLDDSGEEKAIEELRHER